MFIPPPAPVLLHRQWWLDLHSLPLREHHYTNPTNLVVSPITGVYTDGAIAHFLLFMASGTWSDHLITIQINLLGMLACLQAV